LRIKRSLVAVGAIASAAAMVAMVAPVANAEPIGGNGKAVKPAAYDIVGVGSESLTALMDQLTLNYNETVGVKKHSPTDPYILSWDAVPPSNLNNTMQQIVVKPGCKANTRPNGSSAGIAALETHSFGNTSYVYKGKKHVVPCIDFARSSRPRTPGKTPPDAPYAKGGIAFVTLAQDAVTYASIAHSNVPNDLTLNQLKEVFGCTDTEPANGFPAGTWGSIDKNAPDPTAIPDPILPQAGSGTLSFWTSNVLGIGSSEPSCGSLSGVTKAVDEPEENEGTSKYFHLNNDASDPGNPNVIYPFSIGVYVAQEFRSHACGKIGKKGQNEFGCAQNGILNLDGLNIVIKGKATNVPPTCKPGAKGCTKATAGQPTLVTNPALNATIYKRFLYNVVEYATNTSNHIPSYLEKWFASAKDKGYFCGKGATAILNYGFETTPACGLTD
jgi:ABC-type phosphate transport system substrate-binding protein